VEKSILLFSREFYPSCRSGAAVAHRALGTLLQSRGFDVNILCGASLDQLNELVEAGRTNRPDAPALAATGLDWLKSFAITPTIGSRREARLSVFVDDPGRAGSDTSRDFDELPSRIVDYFKPHILVSYGGDDLTLKVAASARASQVATVFHLHNFNYRKPSTFENFDEILAPSRFCLRYYGDYLGLNCSEIPNAFDVERCRSADSGRRYVTFVNPSIEKGVYAFARIADELGRRRPDIPILVVESRGTEATVAACGLELRHYGTVHFMDHTADPRDFWGVTRACLLPSVWWENQPLVAVEAMVNGIPVIGSDRGGIPETLGSAGIVLPLPERITQATRMLPTAEEVEPWVEAVIRLWDDADYYEQHRRKALAEARRWDPEVLEPRYVEFFRNLKPGPKPTPTIPPGRAGSVVLVPHLAGIEPECEDSLRKLEAAGVRVVRSGGNSAIDVARNRLASEALHDGAESILFIDADIGFDPLDALRLLARPEPVVSGVYAKKSRREFASIFAEGVEEVVFGAHAFGLYPLKYAATGFLRIKAAVLRRMVEELDLPHCNTHWGRGEWPFFQPSVVPQGEGRRHYLGEDWAFSDRLARIGVTPMADTSIRLWHYGRYAFGWEDAGAEPRRFATYTHRFGGRDG